MFYGGFEDREEGVIRGRFTYDRRVQEDLIPLAVQVNVQVDEIHPILREALVEGV